MKKIGVIGGIGWPSTIEYYRLICEASQAYHREHDFNGPTPMPEMVVESLNMNFTVSNRGTAEPGSWAAWDEYFNRALKRLERSGAELIVIASVTPHARLAEITKGVVAPVLSIYDALGDYCSHAGIKYLFVLGTMPTMSSPAFYDNLAPFGVEAQNPPSDEQKSKVVGTIGRLYQNQADGAAKAIDEIVRTSISEGALENTAVCLGCTELPLAFPECSGEASFEVNGIRYLNSAAVHASYVFHACSHYLQQNNARPL